jgi:ABC-2 type transport system permease protein
MTSTQTIDVTDRRVPRLGGFNGTLLRIELRRMLRNKRTIFFALFFPAILFFVFGSGNDGAERVGDGNVSAYILISMALYGGALISAAAGANVAVERALGWSRQLRLTPLHPMAYVAVKAMVALAMGALAVTVVNLVGAVQGKADMPVSTWLECAAVTLVCTTTFSALGIFAGYLLPSENVMQVLGPGLAVLSFLGGLFIPLDQYSEVVRHVAYWTPMYGVSEVARSPLTHELPWYAVLNAVVWLGLFIAGAAWRMSKDTARV